MSDTAIGARGRRDKGGPLRKMHAADSVAWQAESVIAYARVLLARSTASDLGSSLTEAYAQQLNQAESEIAHDPERARAEAEAVLDAIEALDLPQGRQVDMVDVFIAQWRAYIALRNKRGIPLSTHLHNSLLFLWEDHGESAVERTLRITTCQLDHADSPPFALPTQLQQRDLDALTPWYAWRAVHHLEGSGPSLPVRHYLAMYVRGEMLCWDASPGFPLANGTPDVRAVLFEPDQWAHWPETSTDEELLARPDPPSQPRTQGQPSRHVSPLEGRNALTIGSSTLLPFTFRAMRTPELWTRPGNGAPPYYEEVSEGIDQDRALRVFIHPSDGRAPLTAEEEDASYKAVLQLDDDKVRAFAICLGAWFAETNGGDPKLPKVRLDANAILAYQGVKQHERAYRREQKEKVARDVWALSGIFIRGPQLVYDAKGRPKTVMVKSRLMEVEQEDEINLFGEELPYAFRIAPASWIKPLLEDGTRYVALLLHPVLRYKPHQGVEKIAMRLGLHLALHWRFRAAHGNYDQPWHIKTLLDSTGITVPSHRESRRRLMEDFERALDQLQTDDVIASWQYVFGAEEDNPNRVFPRWLARTVVIMPPRAVVEQYAALAPRRRLEIAAAKRRRRPQPPPDR